MIFRKKIRFTILKKGNIQNESATSKMDCFSRTTIEREKLVESRFNTSGWFTKLRYHYRFAQNW